MSWISVKDRLPEEDKIHVIITNGGKVREAFWLDGNFWIGMLNQTHLTTHWQPRPEPPKEG